MSRTGAERELVVRCEGVGRRYVRGVERHNLRHLVPGRWGGAVRGESFDALRGVSFTLASGEAIGIVGPNGAGKSTLLKVLAGLVSPTSGTVCHRGRVASVVELGVGFHPDLTGAENVHLTAALHGLGAQALAERMPDIEAFADIGDALDTPVKWYSTGMLARLGFALAVHLDADLLIVDEVLSVGDEDFRQRCLQRLWELRHAGVSLVLVSHDLVLVDRLCDRAIHLERGEVVDQGPAHDVLDRYAGRGSVEGRAWAGSPAVVRSVELARSLVHPGDDVVVRAEIEVHRPIDRLVVDLTAWARLPGVDIAPETTFPSIHDQIELSEEQRLPGVVHITAVVDSFPAVGGKFEWVLSLLDRDGDAPLGLSRATLEVTGPNDAHVMAAIDGTWDLVRTGPTAAAGADP